MVARAGQTHPVLPRLSPVEEGVRYIRERKAPTTLLGEEAGESPRVLFEGPRAPRGDNQELGAVREELEGSSGCEPGSGHGTGHGLGAGAGSPVGCGERVFAGSRCVLLKAHVRVGAADPKRRDAETARVANLWHGTDEARSAGRV